jgi:hypothetical protein
VIKGELGPIATRSNLDLAAIRAGLEAHFHSLNLAAPAAAPSPSETEARLKGPERLEMVAFAYPLLTRCAA